ncbi:hypothetical protein OG607_08795 [Streptomyces sp. NBC_01537]|uniref:hypothetical protein n=1 Tax=Streptomyces sp. NBC_01537 TaxID=2903896 RepID=UPI00386D94D1
MSEQRSSRWSVPPSAPIGGRAGAAFWTAAATVYATAIVLRVIVLALEPAPAADGTRALPGPGLAETPFVAIPLAMATTALGVMPALALAASAARRGGRPATWHFCAAAAVVTAAAEAFGFTVLTALLALQLRWEIFLWGWLLLTLLQVPAAVCARAASVRQPSPKGLRR